MLEINVFLASAFLLWNQPPSGALRLIRGCTSVTASPGHKGSKKRERFYRWEQTGFAVPAAESFGDLKRKSCSCSCEEKYLSCWSMPTGKVKPVLGILGLFDSFQQQSSQTRTSPQRALHINSAAECLQIWELQPEFNPTTKKYKRPPKQALDVWCSCNVKSDR